jgi:hypothetical protein
MLQGKAIHDYRRNVLWDVRKKKRLQLREGAIRGGDSKLYQLYCSGLLKQTPVNYVIRTTFFIDERIGIAPSNDQA